MVYISPLVCQMTRGKWSVHICYFWGYCSIDFFLWIAVRYKVGDPNANRDREVFLSSLEQPRPLNSDDDEFCALLFHL